MTQISRRIVFQGMGGLGIAAALTGCGNDKNPASSTTKNHSDSPRVESSGQSTTSPATSSSSQTTPSPQKPAVLAKMSEVPVGGGLVLPDEKIVLVQPVKDEFLAFSAVCPHQGATVGAPVDGVITCPLHMSKFSETDGALLGGPATSGLTKIAITTSGDDILAA